MSCNSLVGFVVFGSTVKLSDFQILRALEVDLNAVSSGFGEGILMAYGKLYRPWPGVEHYLEQRCFAGYRWTSTVNQKKLAFNTEKKTVSACKGMHSKRARTVA